MSAGDSSARSMGSPLRSEWPLGLNAPDILISGAAGVIAGPIGGLTTIPKKLVAGAAVGCGLSLVSQGVGGRDSQAEGAIGCAFGGIGALLPGESFLQKVFFGTIAAISQAIATYAAQDAVKSNK
jgi:hypothetical protein